MLGREDSKAVLIIDGVNAHSSVNRKVFLHNIRIICPSLSHYVYDCYSSPARSFIIGSTEIKCRSYDIIRKSIIPMILMLVETFSNIPNNRTKLVAYTGRIRELKVWWGNQMKFKTKFGYYAQPSKSWLIIRENYFETIRTHCTKSEVFH